MNAAPPNELPHSLSAWIDAIDVAPPADATARAQQRLLARLHGAPNNRTAPLATRWLAATASAAVIAIAIIAAPLLGDRGSAFAQVQQHLRDFTTLSMRMEQRFGGRVIQQSRTVVDARGLMRTDVGDQISVILDTTQGRMLVLQHGPRQAMSVPIEQADGDPDEALDWLAEIRDFQGKADLLEETRTIDGRSARGWALEVEGTPVVLWADHDGLPLAMEAGGTGGLEIRYRFRFDLPIEPGYLSTAVPAGYQLVGEDER